MLKGDWTVCSKHANLSTFSSQHYWQNLYDHWTSKRIFTLTMHEVFIWPPEFYGENGYGCNLVLLIIMLIVYFVSYEKWVQREEHPNNTQMDNTTGCCLVWHKTILNWKKIWHVHISHWSRPCWILRGKTFQHSTVCSWTRHHHSDVVKYSHSHRGSGSVELWYLCIPGFHSTLDKLLVGTQQASTLNKLDTKKY